MVFILHRYIFCELFKVFVLATVALTLILSLGSMLRPIQEYGVGPEQVVHLLGYFLPITLTFVLPMGALFATALVYGRIASDNELDACRASGISLMTLVYPGLCLAIITSITTLILTFHVVPAFIHRAEKAIKANAKQILFRNIQRKGYYKIPGGRFNIYADQARPQDNLLSGVIIVKFTARQPEKLITAKNAKVVIDSTKKSNEVKIVAQEAYQIDDTGQAYSRQLPISGRFAPLMSDNIKFQKHNQIKKIKANMLEFYPVRKIAMEVRAQLGMEMLSEDITKTITDPDPDNNYYQFITEDRIVMFTAGRCVPRTDKTLQLVGPIRLLEFDKITHQRRCQWDSNKGIIKLQDDQIGSKMVMVLYNPTWDRGGGIKSLAQRHVIKNLPLPGSIEAKLNEDGILETLSDFSSVLKAEPTKELSSMQEGLQRKILMTFNNIIAETHSRLVFGLGTITLILISIAMGIILRGGHLLSAFGVSAVPFAALIVFMMSGRQLTKHPQMSPAVGILVMWTGLVILTIIAIMIYRKLLRT